MNVGLLRLTVNSSYRFSRLLSKMAKIPDKNELKERLTDLQYKVTQEAATEPPFSKGYLHNKDTGVYTCICCGIDLFNSAAKFDSGCGWPAFSEAVNGVGKDDSKSNIARFTDTSHGMKRIEVRCKNCDAHLGHVFERESTPSSVRYCINSASLNFKKN